MKKILSLLLLSPILCFAQDSELDKIFPMKDGSVHYEKVIDIDAASKDDLYKRAKAWVVAHQPVKDAGTLEDPEQGLHSSNIHFSNLMALKVPMQRDSLKSEWHYWYNVRIYVKDGKAKIVADNLRFGGSGTTNLAKVEAYRDQTEPMFAIYPGMKKTKEKFYLSVYNSFQRANDQILADIKSIEEALNTEKKPESDF